MKSLLRKFGLSRIFDSGLKSLPFKSGLKSLALDSGLKMLTSCRGNEDGLKNLVSLKRNERGFVFLELAVGLPLIVLMLWTMSNLFMNTWRKCNDAIADFVMQQDMESIMTRIIETAEIAYDFKIKNNGKELILMYHELEEMKDKDTENFDKMYRYLLSGSVMYRGRTETTGLDNPITGLDTYSRARITKFNCQTVAGHPKLLRIRIEAQSRATYHTLTLTSVVFVRGRNL